MGNLSLKYKKIYKKVEQQIKLNKLNKLPPYTNVDSKDISFLDKHTPKINGIKLYDGSYLFKN